MRGGGEQICFNPELLGGMDGEAFEYQLNVDELTAGYLPSPEDPCVDANNVPASFRLSGLDPTNPDDLFDYLTHPIYHQTAVCLDQAARRWRETLGDHPIDATPRSIDRNSWLTDPYQTVTDLKNSIPFEAFAITFALELTMLPQNDRTIEDMLFHIEYHDPTCIDFALVGAYSMVSDPELKTDITDHLLSRLHSHRSSLDAYYNSDYFVSQSQQTPEEKELRRELSASLFPIFKKHYEASKEEGIRRPAIKAIVELGGEGVLEYVTQQAFEGERGAVEALIAAASIQPEVIPYLARILANSKTPSLDWIQREILGAIAKERIPPDEKLFQAVALTLQKTHGYVIKWFDPSNLLAYMAQFGYKAVYWFRSFLEIGAIEYLHLLRAEVPKAWASIDDTNAQNDLVSCITGGCALPDISPYGPLRDLAFEGMVERDVPAAREKLFKLLGDEFNHLNDEVKRSLVRAIGDYGAWWHVKLVAPDVAFRFFSALGNLRARAKKDQRLTREIEQAQANLASRYRQSPYWISTIRMADKLTQFHLLTAWLEEDAKSDKEGIEDYLLDHYIRNPDQPVWIRKEAVNALKLRGERFSVHRQAIREVLRLIIPLPDAVTQSAANALRDLSSPPN